MTVEHVNVKIMAKPGARVPWHALIPVFHRWIQRESLPGLLIDVADYAHVPNGPGMMLIGHEAFYSVDNRQGRPGLLYNRRTTSGGSPEEQIHEAFDRALQAARALEREPECAGQLEFDPMDLEVFINDRLLAPNTRDTYDKLAPSIRTVFPGSSLTWDSDPRGLFRVVVKAGKEKGGA